MPGEEKEAEGASALDLNFNKEEPPKEDAKNSSQDEEFAYPDYENMYSQPDDYQPPMQIDKETGEEVPVLTKEEEKIKNEI